MGHLCNRAGTILPLISYIKIDLRRTKHNNRTTFPVFSSTFICLFAGSLCALWKSIVFRYTYFSATSIFFSYLVYTDIAVKSDHVWAAFFAALTLAVGLGLTYVSGLFVRPETTVDRHETHAEDAPAANSMKNTSPKSDAETCEETALSYPLDDDEATLLLNRVDDRTWNLLKTFAENSPEPGLAGLHWTKIQALTGSRDWPHFARGVMARIHRDLREITGDPRAVLLLDTEKLDLEGQPSNQGKVVIIHGPAVETLQRNFEREPAP